MLPLLPLDSPVQGICSDGSRVPHILVPTLRHPAGPVVPHYSFLLLSYLGNVFLPLGDFGEICCNPIPSLGRCQNLTLFFTRLQTKTLGFLNRHVGMGTSLRSSNFTWTYLLGTFPALSDFLLAGHRDPFLTFLDISSNSHLLLSLCRKQGKPPLPVHIPPFMSVLSYNLKVSSKLKAKNLHQDTENVY